MYELKQVNLMSSAIGLPDTGCDVVASRVDAPDMGLVQNWSRVRNALKIQSLILPGLGCLVEVSVVQTLYLPHPSLSLLPVVFRPLLPWLDDDEDGDNARRYIFWVMSSTFNRCPSCTRCTMYMREGTL